MVLLIFESQNKDFSRELFGKYYLRRFPALHVFIQRSRGRPDFQHPLLVGIFRGTQARVVFGSTKPLPGAVNRNRFRDKLFGVKTAVGS